MITLISFLIAFAAFGVPAPKGDLSPNDVSLKLDLSGREVRGSIKAPVLLVPALNPNELGLGSRPTFFIGRRQADGPWRGRYVVGSQSYLVFKSVIGKALAKGTEK